MNQRIRRAVEGGDCDYAELQSMTGLSRLTLYQRVKRLGLSHRMWSVT